MCGDTRRKQDGWSRVSLPSKSQNKSKNGTIRDGRRRWSPYGSWEGGWTTRGLVKAVDEKRASESLFIRVRGKLVQEATVGIYDQYIQLGQMCLSACQVMSRYETIRAVWHTILAWQLTIFLR